MNLDNCTVLINSCDSYADVWNPFFTVFKDKWSDCPCPILLNTESKKLALEGLDIHTVGSENPVKMTWGERLIHNVKSIKTDYIIMLFDDFILEKEVNQDKIEHCLAWLESHEEIAVFYFSNIIGKNIEDNNFPDFELLPKRKDYRLNSAPAIWRKSSLLSFIGIHDDPWAWEYFGSARTYKSDDLFYCAKIGKEDVFVYNYILGGAIHRGKWVKSVILPVVTRYNIDIDLNIRGFEDESLIAYRHTIIWQLKFLLTGFKMIRFDIFIFIFRVFLKRISNFLNGSKS